MQVFTIPNLDVCGDDCTAEQHINKPQMLALHAGPHLRDADVLACTHSTVSESSIAHRTHARTADDE